MNDLLFRALLTLHMCDDPSQLPDNEDAAVEKALNEESHRRGYDGWVAAFHEFRPTDPAHGLGRSEVTVGDEYQRRIDVETGRTS